MFAPPSNALPVTTNSASCLALYAAPPHPQMLPPPPSDLGTTVNVPTRRSPMPTRISFPSIGRSQNEPVPT